MLHHVLLHYFDIELLDLHYLSLSFPEKCKHLIFEIPKTPHILNINN